MRFLTPGEIQEWCHVSLMISGFASLSGEARDLWKKLVFRGNAALPPGFLGNLLESFTDKVSGDRHPGPRHIQEDLILRELISDGGFTYLRGKYRLTGKFSRDRILLPALERMCEKVGGFTHSDIHFSEKDCDPNLAGDPPAVAYSPFRGVIECLYQGMMDHLRKEVFHLTPADIFEIEFHELFPDPAARTLYRGMMEASGRIGDYIDTQLSLREDRGEVVARFGEPQILPLGGYESLTNRGDIASLVPSELGYIDENEQIDLFDHKFQENQLLYFKREEGAVFRIRRRITFEFAMTPFFEHERHLSLLFGFFLTMAEKLHVIFLKDIVQVGVVFSGELPTNMAPALNFLRHFLAKQGLDRSVRIPSGQEQSPDDPGGLFQDWIIGEAGDSEEGFIPFSFPQTDEFAGLDRGRQYLELGDAANRIIRGMLDKL